MIKPPPPIIKDFEFVNEHGETWHLACNLTDDTAELTSTELPEPLRIENNRLPGDLILSPHERDWLQCAWAEIFHRPLWLSPANLMLAAMEELGADEVIRLARALADSATSAPYCTAPAAQPCRGQPPSPKME